MVRIKLERFPTGTYKKLYPRSASLFKTMKKISSNAYVLSLLPNMNISSTFNIEDLTIYHKHYQDESFEMQAIQLPMIPFQLVEKKLKMSIMTNWFQQRLADITNFWSSGKVNHSSKLLGSTPHTFRDSIRICTRSTKPTTCQSRVSPSRGELMQARLLGPA